MNYLKFAEQLAYDAGAIMEEYFLGDTQTSYKADNSPVTVADTLINQLVIDRVAEEFPEHSVRGEEQSDMKNGNKYVWVCDPIDGTHFYGKGIALGTFMLALVINGQPEVAVIYEPISNKLYSAAKGKGVRLNNERIRVSKDELAPKVRVDLCDVKDHEIAELRPLGNALYDKGIKVTGVRASGIVGTMVAEGTLVAGITPTMHPHDIAAIKLIVEEAGGKVTDLFGNEQRYDERITGAVFSNGIVHDDLIDLIKQTT